MALKLIKIVDPSGAKLTVQKTGRLGLSKKAADILAVEKYRYCLFHEDDEDEDVLFIQMLEEEAEYSLSINKSGEYFYVNAKALLGAIDVDYTNDDETVIFDVIPIPPETYEGMIVFELKKRVLKK